jgi:hypothetical protein
MTRRVPRAAVLTGALVYAFAVLVHAVVHAIGDEGMVLGSLPHALMLTSALAALAAAGRAAGIGAAPRERRRRVALIRASLRGSSLQAIVAIVAAEAALAAGLLALEGAELAPERILPAAIAGVVALVVSACLARSTGERIVALLAWRVESPAAGAPSLSAFRLRARPLGAGHRALLRRLAFRAPPGFLALA